MHLLKNIKKFLYDQDYFIAFFGNLLHVYAYETLNILSDTLIELKLKEFVLEVKGQNLTIKEMDKKEILIKGLINEVRFIR